MSNETGGVVLSTLSDAQASGDQGVYYANRMIPVRLPINSHNRLAGKIPNRRRCQ